MTLTAAQQDGLVDLVREVAKTGILPRFRQLDATEIRAKTRADDLVTVADLEAEAALTAGIARLLPEAAVVGEEAVSADPAVRDRVSQPGTVVVVDPVDGTWNFAHGLAVFGVILSVVQDGQTVFGLLYDPVFDDWVAARRGGGAWIEGGEVAPRPLRLGDPADFDRGHGFVPLGLYPRADRSRIAAAMAACERAHSLRCSCHEYRQLALGAADFGLATMLNVWDHAAGALTVAEAGGRVALADGTAYRPDMTEGRLIAARGPGVWEAIRNRFEPGAAA